MKDMHIFAKDIVNNRVIKSCLNNGNTIHLLTFQSKEVLHALLENRIYFADNEKSREKRNYSRDVEQLGGKQPIWCFSPVGIKTLVKDKFSIDDFIDGQLFERFRCEMSLPSREDLGKFYLLEIDTELDLIKPGITHNSYVGAVVIPHIESNNLIGIYNVSYIDDDPVKWYYPDIKVLKVFRDDALFTKDFSCRNIKR